MDIGIRYLILVSSPEIGLQKILDVGRYIITLRNSHRRNILMDTKINFMEQDHTERYLRATSGAINPIRKVVSFAMNKYWLWSRDASASPQHDS
jgi:hypothetical protein